ncbi:hypothetical protein ACM55F_15825 [Flavobacterium sp. XS2P12]|uniref:hypothetical protein n=1 Tax=Flavobacterium melibiosi TaxID=3398734 RepID=UPI003A86F6AD
MVDSYNEVGPLKYYTENNFDTLFSPEEQEKQYTGLKVDLTKINYIGIKQDGF